MEPAESSPDPREEQIGRILNDYLDAKARGEATSEGELLAQYPEFADQLREHLAMLREMGGSPGVSRTDGSRPTDQALDIRGGSSFASLPHDSFTGYEIIREIHRGGQGVIYQAVQKSTKRKVAIKVMKEGPFAGSKDKARFEREVQILGALNHPNIVNIHDSGIASGHHYFVMDYISGQTLDVWMSGGEHSIDQTLELFAKICEAVNAAHLKGIIHRDLKPGNIRIDSEGQPHILDFGLAKVATGSEASLMTVTGQFIGSLPWASPEQAEGLPDKIDTRTDVYALGVILYQMLTGGFPYEVVGNMRDVLDRIMKSEPAKPSTIRRQINDEVETIVLKCLSKDRERRYQTAGELARDIGHYLEGEPIEAKRDSGLYVLRKTLRRYRVPVAIAALLASLLVASLFVTTSFWREAVRQRESALAASRKARTAELNASDKAEQALASAYIAAVYAADTALRIGDTPRAFSSLQLAPTEVHGWEWQYLSRATDARLWHMPQDSIDKFKALLPTPNATLIPVAGMDGSLNLLSFGDGRLVKQLPRVSDHIETCAFSRDGVLIVYASAAGDIQLARLPDGSSLGLVHSGHKNITALAVCTKSKRFAVATKDNKLEVWSTDTLKLTAPVPRPPHVITAMTFDDQGDLLAVGTDYSGVYCWRAAESAQPILIHALQHRTSFGDELNHDAAVFALTSDGRAVAYWTAKSGEMFMDNVTINNILGPPTIHIASTSGGDHRQLIQAPLGLRHVVAALSPDARLVSAATSHGGIRMWNATTGLLLQDLYSPLPGTPAVDAMQFSPDGKQLASWHDEGRGSGCLICWDTSTPRDPVSVVMHRDRVSSIEVSQDGKTAVSASFDGTLRVWDPITFAERTSFETCFPFAVAVSGDGEHIALTSSSQNKDPLVLVVSNRTRKVLREIPCRMFPWRAEFVHNGTQLMVGGENKGIPVMTLDTGQEIRSFDGEGMGFSVSADGRWLAYASTPGVVIRDLVSGATVRELTEMDHVCSIAFNRDGTKLAYVTVTGCIRLWSTLESHEVQRAPMSVTPEIDVLTRVRFSPDGSRIAVVSGSDTVALFDTHSGQKFEILRSSVALFPSSLAWAPDGRLMAGAADGTIKVWDIVPRWQRLAQTRVLLPMQGR